MRAARALVIRFAIPLVVPSVMLLAASGVYAGDSDGHAPTLERETAGDIARASLERHFLRGAVCALVGKEGVRDIGAAGLRRKGSTDAITVDDRMHLGSCTKAFTATLAAVLVADGAIRWDSTVGEVLGDSIPDLAQLWRDKTLEALLRHRAGAPPEPEAAAWRAAFACRGTPRECRAAFVQSLLARAPSGKPGAYAYSNQGYAIAGHMLEVVADKDYETLLVERVLAPLGITRAGFGVPKAIDPASPWGHNPDAMPMDIDNPNAIAPAGTLHMPLGDWAKFIAFHLGAEAPAALSGAAGQLKKLHEASTEEPHEALGWKTANREWGGAVLTHAGSNTKWFCVAWLAPERGFAVLAAVNQGGDRPQQGCDEMCSALIRMEEARAAGASKVREAP
jgi:CubicO group peptidase (beta-lactamase class C family)